MASGPLDDAIAVLRFLKEKYPSLNGPPHDFGELVLTIRDGKVYSVGPNPYLVRGKNFHVASSLDKRGSP